MTAGVRVEQIDHVELFVRDRRQPEGLDTSEIAIVKVNRQMIGRNEP